MPLHLRPIEERDLADIVAIEKASFSDPWSAEAFRSMLAHPQAIGTVADEDGAVLGYSVSWSIGDEAELANLAVAPARRGEGIGARLLDGLLTVLDAGPGATVYLEVRASNEAAQRLYASRGFGVAGRRKAYYRRPTEDALVMRRERRVR